MMGITITRNGSIITTDNAEPTRRDLIRAQSIRQAKAINAARKAAR